MTKTPQVVLADYGNWVPRQLNVVNAFVALLFLALARVNLGFLAGAAFFLVAFAYFAYGRWKFSPRGGDLQAKIRQLVLDHVAWDGKETALDVGCGNGPMVVALAKSFPDAEVIGVDLWGGLWDYSEAACQANARTEGVADGVEFRRASASKLPFEDGTFELVVSSLAFHDVKDAADTTLVVKAAL